MAGLLAGPAAAQGPVTASATTLSPRDNPAPHRPLGFQPLISGGSLTMAQAGRPKSEDETDFSVSTDFPDPERLFRRESEDEWKNRMRNEGRRQLTGQRIYFPPEESLGQTTYVPRHFPPAMEIVEPGYVVHRRLYFEQINQERYGWDLGIMGPAVNLAAFYKDTLLLPYHFWTRPFQRYDTSAGKCLPGDPVPLLLYPPEWSLTGFIGEAGTILGGVFIFN